MTYITSWDEFAKAAERLYLADPMKVRFLLKYRHSDGKLQVKVTDNQVVRKAENAVLNRCQLFRFNGSVGKYVDKLNHVNAVTAVPTSHGAANI
ncbi:hypothetical protein V5799_019543 [Amblyomma americanum]|uniref:SRP9 domain-containing protein n=1 Tax=Amblyomma americanum TaxID=6943 RepID=A0AAQ4EX36_AMBAM